MVESSSTGPRIVWRPSSPLPIIEARVADPTPGSPLDGCYVGYVAGDATGVWRGYLGLDFVPVGTGARETLQEEIERWAWVLLRAGAIRRGGETRGA